MIGGDIERVKERILPILKKHGVARAALFGSLVREGLERARDIDLVVEFEGEKSLLDLVALKLDLEEALGKRVDVLTYRGLHPLVRGRILREQVVIL